MYLFEVESHHFSGKCYLCRPDDKEEVNFSLTSNKEKSFTVANKEDADFFIRFYNYHDSLAFHDFSIIPIPEDE